MRGLFTGAVLWGCAAAWLASPLAAEEAGWWSLRPLARPPAPPAPSDAPPGWPRTAIDQFILEKLRENGLQPSPEADRRALIRRLSYDLHGLPPAPEEIERFLADRSEIACEELVDRLLASPRYGERWGRHWLDLVHYGETHGYDKDKRRPHSWPYRDYVIRSLNQDKPYSRFVEEQVAGDVLFPDEPEGIVATGLIAAGPWDFVGHVELREGTVDKEIARSNDRDDMVATVMSTFLSTTAHCARCHDHKFDPIPQADYYGLQAVFAGVDRADRPYDLDRATFLERRSLQSRKRALLEASRLLEEQAAAVRGPEIARLDARIQALEKETALLPRRGTGKRAESPTNGYHSAVSAERDVEKWVQVDLGSSQPIDEVRLIPARPTDFPDTPGFGFPPRFRLEISDDPELKERISLADHTRSGLPNPGDRPLSVPGGGRRARYVRVTATRLWERTGDWVFALAELEVISGGRNAAAGRTVTALDSIESGRWSRAALVDGHSSREPLGDPAEWTRRVERREELSRQAEGFRKERQALVEGRLGPAFRSAREETARKLAILEKELAALPPEELVYAAAPVFAPSGSFTPARGPRPVHILARGDVRKRGEPASPGALSCLTSLPARFSLPDPDDEGSRRAALARWITDRKNVLTWRSIANRVWLYHFGRGLVDTPSDFGRMGSPPTHPELLDWLAVELEENGGSLKALHRLILKSAVYRQESRGRPEAGRVDSENRFLWRMNRSRLDAEEVRDSVLFVSGRLDLTLGGPSADHFLFKDDHSPVYDYGRFDPDSPAGRRRSVYRAIVRSVPEPFMDCLDCPDPSILTPKRGATLTALSALAMLNDPFMVRAAAHLAERVKSLSAERRGQVEAAFRLALGRPPSQEEAELLSGYAARAGLLNSCRVLLNSNEFLFVD